MPISITVSNGPAESTVPLTVGMDKTDVVVAGLAIPTLAEKAALQAADAWLQLFDSGQYAKSWEEAAKYFRNAVPQDKWQRSAEVFREPLGKLVSRQLKSTRYTTSAPGAPDGEYVIIQYTTSFENKKSAIETVTPMLDSDGKWRVSGYFIK